MPLNPVNPEPQRVIVHSLKTVSKAYRFHPRRQPLPMSLTFQPKVGISPGPKIKNQNKSWENLILPNWRHIFFFFTLGNVNYFSLLPEQRVAGPLEEKRLTLRSTSKCLLILRCYLGQPIFSSFSSSSWPSVASNSAFPSTADVGRNACFSLKNKMRKKRGRKRLTSQCLHLSKVKLFPLKKSIDYTTSFFAFLNLN